MFVIAQIPFVDFRILSDQDYENCFFPNQFNKNMNRALYYRFFGQEKTRNDPNDLPLAERHFFDSKKMISLRVEGFKGNNSYCPQLLFARFYEDIQCFHFDIGIRQTDKKSLPPHDLNRFAKDLLQSPLFQIDQRFEKENAAYDILSLEEKIKKIYLYATTSKTVKFQNCYSPQIALGFPALFIIYDQTEKHSFGQAKELKLKNGIKVHHELIPIKTAFADVWYIGKDESKDQDLRNLRIYLSKLHSYKESARLILAYLESNQGQSIDYTKTASYLEDILKRIKKKRFYGYVNNKFWNTAFYVDKTYNYASWDELKQRIEAKLKAFKVNTNYYKKMVRKTLNQILRDEQQLSPNDKKWLKDSMEELIKEVQSSPSNNDTISHLQGIIISFAKKVFINASTIKSIIDIVEKIIILSKRIN